MKIGGITKFSMLDYPGQICTTIYTQGCNRNCSYCHNPEFIQDGPGLIEWDEVMRFLGSRLHLIDAVVFSGGEPTMQPDLEYRAIEASHGVLRVGLHTNGDYLTPEIAELFHMIVLSHPTQEKIEIAKHADNVILSRVTYEGASFHNNLERAL